MLMMVLQRCWKGASYCFTFPSSDMQLQWWLGTPLAYLDQRAVCVLSIPLMPSLPSPSLPSPSLLSTCRRSGGWARPQRT